MSVLTFRLFFFGQTVFCEYYIRNNILQKLKAGNKNEQYDKESKQRP